MSDDIGFHRRVIWGISSLLRRIPRPHIPERWRNIFPIRLRRNSPHSTPESEQELPSHDDLDNTYTRQWVSPPRSRQRPAPSTWTPLTQSLTPSPAPNQIANQHMPPEALLGSNEFRKRKREWEGSLYGNGLLNASDLSNNSLGNGQSSSSSTPNGVQAVNNEALGSQILEQATQPAAPRNSCESDYENIPLESSAGSDTESHRGEDDDEMPPLKRLRMVS
ncbi:hypothetical protein CIB48_g10109 [Xylaria polymorpha]|nr:hypothetical protein CIB48_g10109 [Xylaria polymorpha]